jgi:hydroxymethylpyrimidine pyrophosphatase-like HAD family hydrolase
VHDKRASKDQAIQILIDRLGISKNELTVFGDNSNDIKMFKLAGQSIAVSNATDELKQYATQIMGTNEEDSVVRYILKNS